MKLTMMIAALAAVMSAAPAAAGIKVADARQAILKAAGKHAGAVVVHADEAGEVWFEGRTAEDYKYVAELLDCDAQKVECGRFALSVGFLETGADVADLNPWNNNEYTQAYIDTEGDPMIAFLVIAPDAYGSKNLDAVLAYWGEQTWRFADFSYAAGRAKKVSYHRSRPPAALPPADRRHNAPGLAYKNLSGR